MKTKILDRNQPKKKIFSACTFMPNSDEALKELKIRSERIAKHIKDETAQADSVTYIRFRLGKDEFYGIPYQYAREVMRNALLTRIPGVPAFIAGVINRRGSLLAVLDLKQFFPAEPAGYDEASSSIIIVTHMDITVGILADGILGSDSFSAKNPEAPLPSEAVRKMDYIAGLHEGKTVILDVEKIITDPDLQIRNQKQ